MKPAVILAVLVTAAASPGPMECVHAFKMRNDLARRSASLLSQEVERGALNRAERGPLRSTMRKRDRLLGCGVEREL